MRESRERALSDLRESGAIEQDADLVLFLWRENGKPGEENTDSDGEVINLRLAKHRNGPTGEVKLWFKKSQTRFVSYAASVTPRRSRSRTEDPNGRDHRAGDGCTSPHSWSDAARQAVAVASKRSAHPDGRGHPVDCHVETARSSSTASS